MVFANPVPRDYATGKLYDDLGNSYYLSEAKLEGDYSPVRFERELRCLRSCCTQGPILDVGCSSGGFLFQLTTRFPGDYEVLGTDVSGPALSYARTRGIPILQDSFLAHDFGQQRFQAITFWAVLEHLEEPGAFLEKAASLLRPGGSCFVLVPNLRSLAVRLLGAKYRYIYDQHLNYWTAATLRKLVEKQFSMAELRCTHFNPVVIWQDWRRHGRTVSNQERAELLKRTNAWKKNSALLPLRALYKASESVLGRMGLADNLLAIMRK